MAWQIATLSPERDFDICICSFDRLELPKSLDHLGVRLCQIEAEAAFDGMGRDQRQTVSAYLRLALPDAFADDYDRILYLDSDIFVQGGDLAALLSIDMKGRPIAAVRDNPQWRTPNRRPAELRALGLAAAPYFNSGVLLIETRPWLDANTLGRAQSVGQTQADKLVHKDQTLLNVVFHQNWAEMRKMLWLHYMAAPRMAHYLDRFPTDLTVHT